MLHYSRKVLSAFLKVTRCVIFRKLHGQGDNGRIYSGPNFYDPHDGVVDFEVETNCSNAIRALDGKPVPQDGKLQFRKRGILD